MAKVLELKTSAFYKWGLDDFERGKRDKVLDNASNGDVADLASIIDLNCPRSPQ